jgi:hypothetical protein
MSLFGASNGFDLLRSKVFCQEKENTHTHISATYFPMYFVDGENISFDVNLVIYINSTNIPPIMIINRIYEQQNLLSL